MKNCDVDRASSTTLFPWFQQNKGKEMKIFVFSYENMRKIGKNRVDILSSSSDINVKKSIKNWLTVLEILTKLRERGRICDVSRLSC